MLLVYTGDSVASAFAVTAGTFLAMSIFATVTKRDLSGWSNFLFMGLIGVVIASVVNIFMRSSMMQFVISAAAVVVFTGLTAYDTQRLRRMAVAGAGMAALPVNGALCLYLNFINLFLSILNLFGGRRSWRFRKEEAGAPGRPRLPCLTAWRRRSASDGRPGTPRAASSGRRRA